MIMNPTQKRHALANACEQLERERVGILSISSEQQRHVITVDCPPTWLLKKAFTVTECIKGEKQEISLARLSGCIIRWVTRNQPTAYQLTQNLNPYAPELIAQWPQNL